MDYYGIKINAKKQDDNTAVIDIDGEIGMSIDFAEWRIKTENTNEGFKKQLRNIGDVSEIIVNINSLGGDVNEGISIHDQLRENKAKIITNIKGFTASAATIIAMAGDEINMSDNALFLIHRAWTGAMGNANEMKAIVDMLNTVDDQIANIYEKRTGKSKEDVLELMDKNNGNGIWLNASKAKKEGYIDNVIEPTPKNMLNTVFLNHSLPPIPDEHKELINHKSENKMKINLSNFPNLFSLKKEEKTEEMEVSEDILASAETEIAELKAKHTTFENSINELTAAKDTAETELASKLAEIEAQNAKITALEAENLTLTEKLQAGKTETEKVEDPELQDGKSIKTPNQLAAEKNYEAIKNEIE